MSFCLFVCKCSVLFVSFVNVLSHPYMRYRLFGPSTKSLACALFFPSSCFTFLPANIQTYIHKCIINNEYFHYIRGVEFQPAFWLTGMESHQKLAHCICTAHHNSMSHYALKLFNPLFSLSLFRFSSLVCSNNVAFTYISFGFMCSFFLFAFVVHSFVLFSLSLFYRFFLSCLFRIQGKHIRTLKNFIVLHLFVFKLVTRLDI